MSFAYFLAEKSGYLERFDISLNNIGDFGCIFLLALSSGAGFASKEVQVRGAMLSSACATGKNAHQLRKAPESGSGDMKALKIAYCGAGLVTAVQIAHTLQNTPNIETLDVAGNLFTEVGWYAIMKALAGRQG